MDSIASHEARQRATHWGGRSRYFDPSYMSAMLLERLQNHLSFADNDLTCLYASGGLVSSRRYKRLDRSTTRRRFVDEAQALSPDLAVIFLPYGWDRTTAEDSIASGLARLTLGLSVGNFNWLMDELQVHPLFMEAIHGRAGQHIAYETFEDGGTSPSELHLIVKAPPAGWLRAAFYMRISYDTHKMLLVLAGNDFDSHAEMLAEHLMTNVAPYNPFAIILVLLRRYFYFCIAQSTQVDHAVVLTERATGRGTMTYAQRQADRPVSPDSFDLTFMHWAEGNQRTILYAVQFQTKLTAFVLEEHLVWERRQNTGSRETGHSDTNSNDSISSSSEGPIANYRALPRKARALHDRLRAHQVTINDFDASSQVLRERIQRQLLAADSMINQTDSKVGLSNAQANLAIAEQSRRIAVETRRDSTSMKTIASLTMVYLPSTFAASIFSTGFFTYNPGDRGVRVDTQIWIFALVAVIMTVVTISVWVWLNKRGVPRRFGWARQPSWESDGGDTLLPPLQPLYSARSQTQRSMTNPKISLPAGPDDPIL